MTSRIDDLVARTRAFIDTHVIPVEDEFDGDVAAAGGDELRAGLQHEARAAGVFAPHAPREYGGLGLGMAERAPVFEAAGRSLFGPLALNINAPDEGNLHLLERVATGGQRERYLAPLARGEQRSAFAMTEPPPGAGSDPGALRTLARRDDDGWLITGRKKFITGADGAGFFIVMARTSGEPDSTGGATMFLVPADRTGIRVIRHVNTMDRSMLGGHCELDLTDVRVEQDDVLGALDQGFHHAQVRLGPARLTHVMRWLGAAQRAHETAVRYVSERSAFGRPLAEQGMIELMIADNEIDLAATRSLLLTACRVLDAGHAGREETSLAKVFGAEAAHRVADRAVQMCGGAGVSADLPTARIAREIRPFRIYDGPSEVHRMSLARRAVRRYGGPR
ncbi:Acyl-CoA dehydrogenase [Micromonospora phaseoli]|uniref:Acyl-CoA dehydrogenase n=1 Tax=Micromonospora phaseoli TaxID=1144548 RepID=A0A1H6UZ49_9ACTN|nr:acyl-CoA dehydrogenase family protein [Micromonospora phaseoli]PZV93788.1 alkylation response protein AidB-like acyl-CoA dehydrogenase [Micromonospora phaseoli]GIJ79936.1 acyl-CoA dehydrogenase [Micromonospora phaseoli]SEI97511.1 Acyl-CoA dehydrogenase [Micromonospora phaseoli]